MKVRAILKSLLFAYALTGVALLLLAQVLFAFDLGGTAVDAGKLCVKTNICGVLSQVWLTMYYC